MDFARQIRPLLNTHCTACHGGVKQQGGVSFIYRDQVLAIGESGNPTVVPGKPDQSELMYRITTDDLDDLMPQSDHGPRLQPAEVALIRQWIEEGAEWSDHWSFETPQPHPAPKTPDTEWPQGKIDHFTLARMQEAGLSPAAQADGETLLRRLSLDLTGLPPSLEELDSFQTDEIAATVDRLLASPAFGEKWASMWLDAARYSDTEGLGMDRLRTVWPYRDWVVRSFNEDLPYDEFIRKQIAGDLLPDPTLDDLIATTFHRLTQSNEEGGTDDEEFRMAAVMDRVATTWESIQGLTFACAQCHDHPYDPIKQDDYYSFLAFFNNTRDLDLGNHAPLLKVPAKRSDFPAALTAQRDYDLCRRNFQQAAEAVAQSLDWTKVNQLSVTSTKTATETVTSDGFLEVRTKGTIVNGTDFTITLPKPPAMQKVSALRLDVLPPDLEKAAHSGALGAVLSSIELQYFSPQGGKGTPVKINLLIGDDPTPMESPWASLNPKSAQGWGPRTHQYRPRHCTLVLQRPLTWEEKGELQLVIRHRANAMTGPLCTKRLRISLAESDRLQTWQPTKVAQDLWKKQQQANKAYQAISGTRIPVMVELPENHRRETRPFIRGNWLDKDDRTLPPLTPVSMHPLAPREGEATRLDLANWLASPENPFTARVLVNRVWEQLFGIGLVETAEDFGSSGLVPSHPDLLDDLAVRFQTEMAWSLKTLIREIVLTATYQQSPRHPESRDYDPRNRLLARGPRNRLSAETLRDHHLVASGLLVQAQGGTPVYPPLPEGAWTPFKGTDKWPTAAQGDPNRYRRSLYTYWKRSIPFPLFATFDAPTRDLCSQRRLASNTPLAALSILNDQAFTEMSRSLARRVQQEAKGQEIRNQLTLAYRLGASRTPSEATVEQLELLYQKTLATYQADPTLLKQSGLPLESATLAVVTNTILNLDAALTK